MALPTVFGKETKKRLVDINKSQTWLIEQIEHSTGLKCDSSYLYKILTGQRKAPKIVSAICEILDLPAQDHNPTNADH